MARRFREGDRVMFVPDMIDATRRDMPSPGALGTVAKVAGFRGSSIHPDPLKSMIFVEWDEYLPIGVAIGSVRLMERR